MHAECTTTAMTFQGVAGRDVEARFNGGILRSDGGAVLLCEVDRATNLLGQFAACLTNHRDPTQVTHPVAALVRQRVHGLALGYDDLDSHDALRHDPLIAVLAESAAPAEILLDLDAMDDLVHRAQAVRFFHGYCGPFGYFGYFGYLAAMWRVQIWDYL